MNLVEPLLHYIYIYAYIYIHNVKAVQPNSHLSHKWRNISRGQPYGHVPYKPPAFTKEHPVDMKTGARPDSLTVLGCRFLRTDRSNPRAATLDFLPLIDIKTKWPTFRMRHFIFFSLVEFPICYVSSGLIDYQSVSVQVRAWCWTGEKPLFGQLMASFTDIYKHHYFIISLTKASLDGCNFQRKLPGPTEYRQRHPVCTDSEAVNDNGIFMREI